MGYVAVDIEQRLAVASADLREREAVEARCRDLDARVEGLVQEVARLRTDLADEERRVRRSFARLVVGMWGRREGAVARGRDGVLARRRAVVDEARARLAEATGRLAAARHARAAALTRLDELATAPAAYRSALADKERHLRRSRDPRGRRLSALADERSRLRDELRALEEASHAAE